MSEFEEALEVEIDKFSHISLSKRLSLFQIGHWAREWLLAEYKELSKWFDADKELVKVRTENQLLKEKAKGLVEALEDCKAEANFQDCSNSIIMIVDEALKAFSNEKGEE